jgi:molybdopterin converting factor small subunit
MANGEINVDVALYGPIAHAAGGHHVAQRGLHMESEATMGDLTSRLGLDRSEIGYIFVNAVLCDVPGMSVSEDLQLEDGDHVGIFSRVHMWPYQYRDGIRMSPALREALSERGAMHHTYAGPQTKHRPSS